MIPDKRKATMAKSISRDDKDDLEQILDRRPARRDARLAGMG
jgi:hypothetical protein